MYTRQELLDFLRNYFIEFGKTPTQKEFNKAKGYPTCTPYYNAFGTWSNAIKQCDLPMRETRNKQCKYVSMTQEEIDIFEKYYGNKNCRKKDLYVLLNIDRFSLERMLYAKMIEKRDRKEIIRKIKTIPQKNTKTPLEEKMKYYLRQFKGTNTVDPCDRIIVQNYDEIEEKLKQYLNKNGIKYKVEKLKPIEGFYVNSYLLERI